MAIGNRRALGFSCGLGILDNLVQLLACLGHLAELGGNRVKIPGWRNMRAIQIIDAEQILERTLG
jgi:hypothetical protein